MEVERETQMNKNAISTVAGVELPVNIKSEHEKARGGGVEEKKSEFEEKKKDWVIDVNKSPLSSSVEEELSRGEERECRICHLSTDEDNNNNNRSELRRNECLIELGCVCKGELGVSHLHCAQIWFKLKGNRLCEICGKQAKNVTGVEEECRNLMAEQSVRLMTIRRRTMATTLPEDEESIGLYGQRCCNVLLVCLVLAFVVPWVFRLSML